MPKIKDLVEYLNQKDIPEMKGRSVLEVAGNLDCGPASVLLSLLVQGILQNKRQKVIHFIEQGMTPFISKKSIDIQKLYHKNKC